MILRRGAILCMALIAWGLFSGNVVAKDSPQASTGDLHFVIDTAGFRAEEGTTYQEIYLMLPDNQLVFEREGVGQLVAEFDVTLQVTTFAGDLLYDQVIPRGLKVDANYKHRAVTDVFSVTLLPKGYWLKMAVEDKNSGKRGVCKMVLPVRKFDQKKLSISDVQFGSHINRAEKESRFAKNGVKVVPNVLRQCAKEYGLLCLYFEVYNLAINKRIPNDQFTVYYTIFSSTGEEVKRIPSKKIRKPGTTCVMVEMLDLSDVPPGDYLVSVRVHDPRSEQRFEHRRPFRLTGQIRPGLL